ncbi:hypothetical protein YC2023_002350 [Brassica napus]
MGARFRSDVMRSLQSTSQSDLARATPATCPERRTEVARISHPSRSDLPKRHPEVARVSMARRHEAKPGATSQSDLPRSLPIQSDPLERHTKVARDLSPGHTKNRPWSDFPERHLQVAPRYFAAENHDFLRTFLQFILDSLLRIVSRLKVDSLIDHLPSLVRYLITQGLIPMPMSSLFP